MVGAGTPPVPELNSVDGAGRRVAFGIAWTPWTGKRTGSGPPRPSASRPNAPASILPPSPPQPPTAPRRPPRLPWGYAGTPRLGVRAGEGDLLRVQSSDRLRSLGVLPLLADRLGVHPAYVLVPHSPTGMEDVRLRCFEYVRRLDGKRLDAAARRLVPPRVAEEPLANPTAPAQGPEASSGRSVPGGRAPPAENGVCANPRPAAAVPGGRAGQAAMNRRFGLAASLRGAQLQDNDVKEAWTRWDSASLAAGMRGRRLRYRPRPRRAVACRRWRRRKRGWRGSRAWRATRHRRNGGQQRSWRRADVAVPGLRRSALRPQRSVLSDRALRTRLRRQERRSL